MARASDFKLLDRRVVRALLSLPERGTFFRALVPWTGFRETEVEFRVAERRTGKSRWSFVSLARYAAAGIAGSTAAPLQIVTVLGCAVLLLFSHMRMNVISDESATMERQRQELLEDRTRLEIRYESTFDLAEVETYAKTVLGMVKAGADQTTFVRSTEGDRAQILTEQGFFADWERKLDALARRLQAYFD